MPVALSACLSAVDMPMYEHWTNLTFFSPFVAVGDGLFIATCADDLLQRLCLAVEKFHNHCYYKSIYCMHVCAIYCAFILLCALFADLQLHPAAVSGFPVHRDIAERDVL